MQVTVSHLEIKDFTLVPDNESADWRFLLCEDRDRTMVQIDKKLIIKLHQYLVDSRDKFLLEPR